MTTKVIYFTAGPIPTPEEKADIEALNALRGPLLEVAVRNSQASLEFGADFEATDYVAGSPPSDVPPGDTQYNDMDEFDVTEPPSDAFDLPGHLAVVYDGLVIDLGGGATVTISVTDGVVDAAYDAGGG